MFKFQHKNSKHVLSEKHKLEDSVKELDEVLKELSVQPLDEFTRKSKVRARLHKKLLEKQANSKRTITF